MNINIPIPTIPNRVLDTLAFSLAVGLDVTVKEPPTNVHPVQAMGAVGDLLHRYILSGENLKAKGLIAWMIGAFGVLGTAKMVSKSSWPVRGVVLWTMMSFGMLIDEVKKVHDALEISVEEGRNQVANLVSRDTTELTETEVAGAAIESLAENMSDGVIAPAFWWAVGGLPGAMLYKYANTLDSKWGYQDDYWADRGYAAAKIDDFLNYIPARLTALAITPELDAIADEAKKTPSPNAGWPMAAMAHVLKKRLDKPGVYSLNETRSLPTRKDIAKAIPYAARAGIIGLTVCAVVRLLRQ